MTAEAHALRVDSLPKPGQRIEVFVTGVMEWDIPITLMEWNAATYEGYYDATLGGIFFDCAPETRIYIEEMGPAMPRWRAVSQ